MFGSLHRLVVPASRSVEREHIELVLADGRQIDLQRVRDPRAKRIKLSVDERGARLTLPLRASLVSGDRFVRENQQWLLAQLEKYKSDQIVATLTRGVTTSLPLRGQPLPLHWHEGRYTKLELSEQALHFHTPARVGESSLRRVLREFYEAQARADLGRWLPAYLPDLPRAPSRLRLKVMSSQWGSLSPDGSLALDLSLVLGRPSAFEYVLVHELCHLIHANHSAAFWHEVEHRFPTWRDEREYFHAHGRQLKAELRGLLGK